MTTTDSNAETTAELDQDHGTMLTIEISPELLRRIEDAAAQRDLSVLAYIEDVLEQAAPKVSAASASTEPARTSTQQALDPFRDVREAILQTTCGVLLDDSVEEIRRMREERTMYLESL